MVRKAAVLIAAIGLIATAAPTFSHAADAPDQIGAFSKPFVEHPSAPFCVKDKSGYLICKPTAVNSMPLADGRVLYWNGLDGNENVQFSEALEVVAQMRNARSRILDLRSGSPVFSVPSPEDGGASNPEVSKNIDPRGELGVPGRPGDGLAGSTFGQMMPGPPYSPPDDPKRDDGDLFCSYQVQLADGRILAMGGGDWYNEPPIADRYGVVELQGIRNARIFDPKTNHWTQTGLMNYGRWYPSAVTLPNGNVFVAGGVAKLIKSTQGSNVLRAETYNLASGKWTVNYTGSSSETSLPLYARMHLMPNGKIFYEAAGQQWAPFGQAADEGTWVFQRLFDLKTSAWQTLGLPTFLFRGSPLDAMLPLKPPYDKATILEAGGDIGPSPGGYIAVPYSEEITVTKDGTVTNKRTGDLNNPRWMSQGVVLPDGKVMAFSGGTVNEVEFAGSEMPVTQAEIYDPAEGTWSRAATATRGRTYHNSAVLLADGRVLVGGHAPFHTGPLGVGYGGSMTDPNLPGFASSVHDPTFELYSPAYLFRGPRPSITHAQRAIKWGQSFNISTPQASEIESVMLVRLMATTHVIDNDQRALYLSFHRAGDHLVVAAPPSGVVAPPGPYYLFINKRSAKGPIPSVARIVFVGSQSDTAEAAAPFAKSTVLGKRSSRALAATGLGRFAIAGWTLFGVAIVIAAWLLRRRVYP